MKSIQASASSDGELRCGAKTRAGKHCEAHPMKNGRCRMHGGTSTGAPRGNFNSMTHGFYSNRLWPGEHELLKQAKAVTIDDDIVLMKVMLHRLLRVSGNSEGEVLMVMRCIEAIRKLMLAKWMIEGGSELASYQIA